MTSKLEVLNPHQAVVLLKNDFTIPKLQYVLRDFACLLLQRRVIYLRQRTFDSQEEVENVSFEGDVSK